MAKLRLLVPEATRNYVKNPSARFDITGWVSKGVIFILLDKFTTDQAAPLTSPRSCEPGPGTLTLVDTGNKLRISGGILINDGSVADSTNPIVSTNKVSYSPGRAAYVKFWRKSSETSAGQIDLRFDDVSVSRILFFGNLGVVDKVNRAGSTLVVAAETSGNMLDLMVECILFVDGEKVYTLVRESTMYPQWTILWVGIIDPDYVGRLMDFRVLSGTINSIYNVDDMSIFDLYGSFQIEYGLATNRVPVPSSGSTAVMTPDALVNFTWVPTAAETMELDIRRTDDNNRWVIRCSQSGSTIKIIQRENSVETERASAAKTWTAGTEYTIQVRAVANNIRTLVDSVSLASYTSATFNNTETGVKVSGFASGSNLVSFPRTLSDVDAAEIDRYFP